jgi:hypothetical protein
MGIWDVRFECLMRVTDVVANLHESSLEPHEGLCISSQQPLCLFSQQAFVVSEKPNDNNYLSCTIFRVSK